MRITLRGLWTVRTIEEYQREAFQAGERLVASGCPAEEILALVDARAMGPQSQEGVAKYRDLAGRPEVASRRLATLVTSALFRRQVDRIGVPNQRVFENEQEALAWLLNLK